MQRIFQMKEETLIRANGIKSQIAHIDYDSCALRKLLDDKKALLQGMICEEIARKAITEQLDLNEKEIQRLQKEFDEL